MPALRTSRSSPDGHVETFCLIACRTGNWCRAPLPFSATQIDVQELAQGACYRITAVAAMPLQWKFSSTQRLASGSSSKCMLLVIRVASDAADAANAHAQCNTILSRWARRSLAYLIFSQHQPDRACLTFISACDVAPLHRPIFVCDVSPSSHVCPGHFIWLGTHRDGLHRWAAGSHY